MKQYKTCICVTLPASVPRLLADEAMPLEFYDVTFKLNSKTGKSGEYTCRFYPKLHLKGI